MADEQAPAQQPQPPQVPPFMAALATQATALMTAGEAFAAMGVAHPIEMQAMAALNFLEMVCAKIPATIDTKGVPPNILKAREALLAARASMRTALDSRVHIAGADTRLNGKRIV